MSTTTSSPVEEESIFVLYGSQTGNSEGAAKDFCTQLSKMYTPSFFQQHGLPYMKIKTECIQLDDFLELKHAAFTKCLVIFVSSYGVGQAPLGAYRFRELCDYWTEHQSSSSIKSLDGLYYAICGLGDSTYRTKFVNPTRIDQGLTNAGAKRVGELGKADANGTREEEQEITIAKWMKEIWIPLAKQLCTSHGVQPPIDTFKMQKDTIPILKELDPQYQPPKEFRSGGSGNGTSTTCSPILLVGIAAVGIVVSILALQMQ